MLWLLLRFFDGIKAMGRMMYWAGRPIIRFLVRIIKALTLDLLLNGYFLTIKARKQLRGIASSGSHRIVTWLNRYMYKLTLAAIIALTVGSSLFSKPLSAEELRSNIILSSIITDESRVLAEIREEGPLQADSTRQVLSYLEGGTVTSDTATADPSLDSDNAYATSGESGAIISPIITDTEATPSSRRDKIETYLVQSGDTISTIAERFGISVNTVMWANNLSWNSTIRPGQELKVLPTSGVSHTIARGETVSSIAKKYQVTVNEVVDYNKLADAGDVQIGEQLVIPGGVRPTTIAIAPQPSRSIGSIIQDIFVPEAPPDQDAGGTLLWPIRSRHITQYFSFRHSGLDVGDRSGNPIFAAESGKVERSGWTAGYGYNIIINHGNGLKTLYAHSSKLLAAEGDSVSRGQTIALIGSTGRSTGPHLHFEVISDGSKTNPLNYIR